MSDQTRPCDYCGFPNPLGARTCEACGQPVRVTDQEATILVHRPPEKSADRVEELLGEIQSKPEDTAAAPEPPAAPLEAIDPAKSAAPQPEPFSHLEPPDYPMVTPKPLPKRGKTGLIIAVILVGGLLCLLGVTVGGYFLFHDLSSRFKPTLESLVVPLETNVPTLAEATFEPIPLEPSEGLFAPSATQALEIPQATLEKPSVLTSPAEGQMTRDVIIIDDFETDVLEWGTSSDDISIHQYEDGAYSILVKQPEYIAWTTVPVDFYPVYTEFDAWVQGDGDGGTYGVLCNFQNDEDYYYVEIDLYETAYSIGHYLNGEYTPLTDWDWPLTDALNPGSKVNRIYVACESEQIMLFINDQFVTQVPLSEPASAGEMAIFGSTWDDMPAGGYKVYFDNLSAWKPEE